MSSTVIKWAEFPEIIGQTPNLKFGVAFPPNYASNEEYVRNFMRLLKICIGVGAISIGLESTVLAADGLEGLDSKARVIYDKGIVIAQWVVCGKGGIDAVGKALKEDFEGAKKSVYSYLTIFLILIGYPHMLDFVKGLFEV